MAYMSQEHKTKISAALKKAVPHDWKYSLSVRHHSTIVLTISAAPIDLIAVLNSHIRPEWKSQEWKDYAQVNVYHLKDQFDSKLLETFEKINTALNIDNYDHSDIQTDYFNVGHYVDINIGRWDKPFQVVKPQSELSYDELKAKVEALERLRTNQA